MFPCVLFHDLSLFLPAISFGFHCHFIASAYVCMHRRGRGICERVHKRKRYQLYCVISQKLSNLKFQALTYCFLLMEALNSFLKLHFLNDSLIPHFSPKKVEVFIQVEAYFCLENINLFGQIIIN